MNPASIGLIENDKGVLGTGFVLDKNHLVLTCFHVIEHQKELNSEQRMNFQIILQ